MMGILKDAAMVIIVICVALAIAVALTKLGLATNIHHDAIERDFHAACEAVNGKAIWSGKVWECLK